MRYHVRLASCVIATGLAGAMLASDALAQSCDPLVPIQNPSFAGSTNGQPVTGAPWTATINTTGPGTTDGWSYDNGLLEHTDDYSASLIATSAYNSFQQTLAGGVTGGSVIDFDLQWANSANTPLLGRGVEFEVLYGGVVYARLTTPVAGATDTSKTAVALNSAGISVSPAWTSLPASTWAKVSVTLPFGMSPSGVLQFRSRRNDTVSGPTDTDDLYFREPVMRTPTLCLRKQSNQGTGTFDFDVFNADTNLATGFQDGSASIITSTAGVPVAFDAWAGSSGAAAGTTPMLLTEYDQPVEITETPANGFVLGSVDCTGGASASVSGNTATITGIAVAVAPTVCTFTNNLALADLQISSSANPTSVITGDIVTYTLTVTNAGAADAVDAVLLDTPGPAQICTVPAITATCTATGGALCPGGGTSGTVTVAALTGSGVTLPSVPVGGQVVVALQCQVTATGN